jgi:GGDEF domain-containing protein
MKLVKLCGKADDTRSDDAIEVRSLKDHADADLADPDHDAFLIDPTDLRSARQMLRRIRAIDFEDTYLKPAYLVTTEEPKDEYLLALSDGYIQPDKLPNLIPLVGRIKRKADRLESVQTDSHESKVAIKLLRYLFTRQRPLEPIVDVRSRLGFAYPFLSVNFLRDEEHKVFGILEHAERERFVDGIYIDRINLCNRCFSSFLDFRETCPACSSSDLASQDLIHHFVCAYVGPEADFLKDEALQCPKCLKTLRHIGVDYDKPSAIYSCARCNEKFQDPKISALCFYCKNDTQAENLAEKHIKRFTLTAKGEHAAIYGTKISMKEVIKVEGMVPLPVFTTIIRYEVERIKRQARPSCIAYLQFLNFQELYLLGAVKERIFPEILRLIKESIRPSDVLSYLNETTLVFLFNDTPAEGAKVPLERLRENLVKLVKDNFKGFEPRVFVDASAVQHDFSLDEFMKRIVAS